MQRNIEEVEFTIFDTETTGLDPRSGDRIIEIAGIRFRGEEVIANFQSLINPLRPISPGAFQVNHISQEMLKDAPTMDKVLPGFLEFIKDSCLCSYNAGFDLEFLNNELKLAGQKSLDGIVVADILRMARRLLPNQERYALWFIADKLGVKAKQQHRAFSDVEMTLGVFNNLKQVLAAKNISSFMHFASLFAINPDFPGSLNAQKLTEIQEAIDLGGKLKIKYLSASGLEVTEREVIPREIKQENGFSYLIGYCCLRKDERTFRVDGILHIELL